MDKKGLTFIEVIASMLILSVVAAGMFYVFSISHKSISYRSRASEAINFARGISEAIRSQDFYNTELSETIGHVQADADGFLDHSVVYPGAFPEIPSGVSDTFGYMFNGTSYLRIEDVDSDSDSDVDYKKVTVKIHWDEPD